MLPSAPQAYAPLARHPSTPQPAPPLSSLCADPEKEDPFSLFVASTNIRYCYYSETHKILGSTYGMLVLQVGGCGRTLVKHACWAFMGAGDTKCSTVPTACWCCRN